MKTWWSVLSVCSLFLLCNKICGQEETEVLRSYEPYPPNRQDSLISFNNRINPYVFQIKFLRYSFPIFIYLYLNGLDTVKVNLHN